jgi:hypothetical protein
MTADTGMVPEKQLASEPPSLATPCTPNFRQKKSQAADGRLGFKNA